VSGADHSIASGAGGRYPKALCGLNVFWPVLVAAWWGIALSLFSFVGLLSPPRTV
jgi:hypothetical protein